MESRKSKIKIYHSAKCDEFGDFRAIFRNRSVNVFLIKQKLKIVFFRAVVFFWRGREIPCSWECLSGRTVTQNPSSLFFTSWEIFLLWIFINLHISLRLPHENLLKLHKENIDQSISYSYFHHFHHFPDFLF